MSLQYGQLTSWLTYLIWFGTGPDDNKPTTHYHELALHFPRSYWTFRHITNIQACMTKKKKEEVCSISTIYDKILIQTLWHNITQAGKWDNFTTLFWCKYETDWIILSNIEDWEYHNLWNRFKTIEQRQTQQTLLDRNNWYFSISWLCKIYKRLEQPNASRFGLKSHQTIYVLYKTVLVIKFNDLSKQTFLYVLHWHMSLIRYCIHFYLFGG